MVNLSSMNHRPQLGGKLWGLTTTSERKRASYKLVNDAPFAFLLSPFGGGGSTILIGFGESSSSVKVYKTLIISLFKIDLWGLINVSHAIYNLTIALIMDHDVGSLTQHEEVAV